MKHNLLTWLSVAGVIEGFVVVRQPRVSCHGGITESPRAGVNSCLFASGKQSRSSLVMEDEEELVEEVYGAKFFGGSAQKEELFDETEEAKAGSSIITSDGTFDRFQDTSAFPDEEARALAQKLQMAINYAIYTDDATDNEKQAYQTIYDSNSLQWESCFTTKSKNNPLEELSTGTDFYRRFDVAILAAQTMNSNSGNDSIRQMKVQWEVSVVFPNVWEPRVLLSGSSATTVDVSSNTITKQNDVLNDGTNDVVGQISSQYKPRFWDLYHVGMTPNAELLPKFPNKSKPILGSYQLYDLPSRWAWKPTLADTSQVGADRDDRLAEGIPNHAFTTAIRTTGPKTQRYVPTSPVQVNINRKKKNDETASYQEIEWTIYLPPEFLSTCSESGLPMVDQEDDADDEDENHDEVISSKYAWEPRRLVATLPFGGSPQDLEVTKIRQQLYEKVVVKDGYKPKLDENGRPIFFFWQNDCKACFTSDGGLGMAVYDWRPKSAKGNEVGIELELSE